MRPSFRAGALLAAGSLAVHELRYIVGYGEPAAVGGHGYLAVVAPIVALALALACGLWIARLGRAVAPATRGPLTWAASTAVLVGVFLAQESVEALTAAGHPGLFAHGGWLALPIAVAVGGMVALVLCGARVADDAAAAVSRPFSPLAAAGDRLPIDFALPSLPPAVPRPRVIARRLAGRAPPVAS
jgi:hypothetical protein